jgi:hypothetical protein
MIMYDVLLRLYQEGKLTEVGLSNAVEKGWITEAEKQKIMASTE